MSVSGEERYWRKLPALVYSILPVPESGDAGSVVLIGRDRNPTWSEPERERQTDRQTDRERHRQRNRDRQTDRQTWDRQTVETERDTERETDKQTLRQRQRETETPSIVFWHLPSELCQNS